MQVRYADALWKSRVYCRLCKFFGDLEIATLNPVIGAFQLPQGLPTRLGWILNFKGLPFGGWAVYLEYFPIPVCVPLGIDEGCAP